MVQLYGKILEYQIRLMRQSSHHWALRYGRDVFKSDEWKTMLSQIEVLDSTCSRLAEELGQEELEAGMKENNFKIDTLLQSWNLGLHDLQEQGTNTYLAMDAHAREDHSWREREETRKLLQALRAKNPYQDQLERTSTRQPGTCNWFLRHRSFHKWREDASSRLLWVSANPGCGKSVLSKCLVEEKLATLDPEHATVCYFFFKDISPDSRSITKALSAILHQLFTRKPSLIEHAVSAFDENGAEISSMFSAMWEILEDAAADLKAGEIVCVLDALDECEEAQQITLIEKLKAFHSKERDSGVRKQKLRFLLTSRPYRSIRTQFHSLIRQFPTIHLSGDDESDLIKEEIDLVIQSEVSAIASERCLDTETEEYLLKQLLSIENRTYLWLHLILDQIRNSDNAGNKKAIRKEIQLIPHSVSKAYEAILAKIKNRPLATKLLHVIVGAETALTLEELNVAMSIENESRSYKELELESAMAFEIRVKSICGLFIYTDRSKVFLIHQTAKEFLRWNQDVPKPPAGMWQHSLNPEESHSVLAGICVSLLMFDEFQTDPLSTEGLDNHVSTAQLEKYCDAHVFLDYAAPWWNEHLRSSPLEGQIALLQKTAYLCNVQSRRCWTWLSVKRFAEDGYQPSGFTDLILACDLGLVALVKHVLSKGADLEARDKEGATALNRAVDQGNVEVVRILLQHGANIEADDWDTPWREDIDENGSEREVKKFSGRPLMLATIHENHTMMRELLAGGADLQARSNVPDNSKGENALTFATTLGNEETMRVLLDWGADVNARVEYHGQLRGHGFRWLNQPELETENLFFSTPRQKLLTDQDLTGMFAPHVTALECAVWQDDAAKVGLLLECGADPEAEIAPDTDDNTTKISNHSAGVESSVSDPDREDDGGEGSERISTIGSSRPESSRGDESSFGSDPDSANEVERPNQPGRGHDAVEVDPDRAVATLGDEIHIGHTFDGVLPPRLIVEEWEGTTIAIPRMTLLHFAVSRGVEDIVRLFLQHGAFKKPVSVAPSEPTALHLAVLVSSTKVVKMLLDQTINVSPKDHRGRTPLHLAVWCGYYRTVNELLEHGADTEATDDGGNTPLEIAMCMGHDLVVRDLLDYGADLRKQQSDLPSTFSRAGRYLDREMI